MARDGRRQHRLFPVRVVGYSAHDRCVDARCAGPVALVTAASLLLPFGSVAHAQPGGPTVTILHFNDVYEITPVDAAKAGGLARLARFRAELKAKHPAI